MARYARLGLLAVALAPACNYQAPICEGDWAAMPAEQAPPMSRARVVAQVLPVETKAVDILFVIDNSRSMTDEQEQLGIWSNELFDVLAESGELPDLHIGVATSTLPISGHTGCETGGGLVVGSAVLQDVPYIRDIAGPDGRVRNYTGTLEQTFAKMARVGDGGCGYEQPFAAARLALSPYATASKGFLRPEALLLVVFVTDEDDCSAKSSALFGDHYADSCSEIGPITGYRCFEHGVVCYDGKGSRSFGERNDCRPNETSSYVESVKGFADSLKRLKANPAQVIVAGIYGKPNRIIAIPDEKVAYAASPRLGNVCGDDVHAKEGTGATPAVRMNALMAEFGGRASHSSICESELAWAMRDMGLVTRGAATRSHCLRGALTDVDPATPGVQPTCQMKASSTLGTPNEVRSDIPPCDGAGDGKRCFIVESDASCADTETSLAFRVYGRDDNETVLVSCDVDVDIDDARVRHASIGETRAPE